MSADKPPKRKTPWIRPTPSGKWQARYRDPSGRLRGRTFTRKTDAQAFLDEVNRDVRRGEWKDPALQKTTFAELAQRWLPSIAHLEANTRSQRELELRVRLLPRFGERPIGSISDFDIQEFKADLLAAGLAPATVSKSLMTLSLILKAGVVNGYINRNPCATVKKPGDTPLAERIFLTPEQLHVLADAIDPRFRAMVLLAGYRGLRFGEIAGLRPSKLNLLLGRIDISEALKEVRGELSFGTPKHGRRRTVALPPFLVAALDQHLVQFPPQNNVVFTSADGSLLRRSNFSRRVWKPAVHGAGLLDALTFHGLRHTAVSILTASGASIVELAAVMGWAKSTAAAMAVRYGHLFDARENQLTDAVETLYRVTVAAQTGLCTTAAPQELWPQSGLRGAADGPVDGGPQGAACV
ncbi:MAG: tyrosine-type recombinase/integrase [Actinomycetota bacterium]